jgi:hypothetical protein
LPPRWRKHALRDLASQQGCVLTVGHIEASIRPHDLKQRLESGELGRVFQMHAAAWVLSHRIQDVGVIKDSPFTTWTSCST